MTSYLCIFHFRIYKHETIRLIQNANGKDSVYWAIIVPHFTNQYVKAQTRVKGKWAKKITKS